VPLFRKADTPVKTKRYFKNHQHASAGGFYFDTNLFSIYLLICLF
jgi:hypothetical protein